MAVKRRSTDSMVFIRPADMHIFARLGRYASAEVIIQLLQSKCMPVLLYDLEACSINSSDYISLEHPVTIAFMKVFKTNSVTVINECREAFSFDTVRRQIIKGQINCLVKMCKNINSIGATVAINMYLWSRWRTDMELSTWL